VNDHLNRKGKVIVGNNTELRNKLISMFHNSAMGGYLGMTMTSKTVGGSVLLKKAAKTHQTIH